MGLLRKFWNQSVDYVFRVLTRRERKRLIEDNAKLRETILRYETERISHLSEKSDLEEKITDQEATLREADGLVSIYQAEQKELKRQLEDVNNRYNQRASHEAQNFGRLNVKTQRALLSCIPLTSSVEPAKKIKLNNTHSSSRCESRCYLSLLDRLSHIEYIERLEDVEAVQSKQTHVKPNHEYIEVVYKAPDRPGGCYKFRVYTSGEKKELVTEMIRQLIQ
jgi:septal ring factor EnvC (AmiA/AmiB activator)